MALNANLRKIANANKLALGVNQLNIQKLSQIIKECYNNYEELDLSEHPQDWEQVVKCRKWRALKSLFLSQCGISVYNMKILTKIVWHRMEFLDLSNNNIGNKGVKILIKANIQKLRILFLNQAKIGNEGMKYLSKGLWPNLRHVQIWNNFINQIGYQSIKLGAWKQIQKFRADLQQPVYMLSLISMSSQLSSISNDIANENLCSDFIAVSENRFCKEKQTNL